MSESEAYQLLENIMIAPTVASLILIAVGVFLFHRKIQTKNSLLMLAGFVMSFVVGIAALVASSFVSMYSDVNNLPSVVKYLLYSDGDVFVDLTFLIFAIGFYRVARDLKKSNQKIKAD